MSAKPNTKLLISFSDNGKRDQTSMGWKFTRKYQRRQNSGTLRQVCDQPSNKTQSMDPIVYVLPLMSCEPYLCEYTTWLLSWLSLQLIYSTWSGSDPTIGLIATKSYGDLSLDIKFSDSVPIAICADVLSDDYYPLVAPVLTIISIYLSLSFSLLYIKTKT